MAVWEFNITYIVDFCVCMIVLGLVRCDQVNEKTVLQLNQHYPHVFLSTVTTEMKLMCEKAGFPDLCKQ